MSPYLLFQRRILKKKEKKPSVNLAKIVGNEQKSKLEVKPQQISQVIQPGTEMKESPKSQGNKILSTNKEQALSSKTSHNKEKAQKFNFQIKDEKANIFEKPKILVEDTGNNAKRYKKDEQFKFTPNQQKFLSKQSLRDKKQVKFRKKINSTGKKISRSTAKSKFSIKKTEQIQQPSQFAQQSEIQSQERGQDVKLYEQKKKSQCKQSQAQKSAFNKQSQIQECREQQKKQILQQQEFTPKKTKK